MSTTAKSSLHDWAAELVTVVQTAVTLTDDDIRTMGFQDGLYVPADDALKIIAAFEASEDHYASQLGMHSEDPPFMYKKTDSGTRGLIIAFDEGFPNERCMYFYDANYF